MVVSYQACKGIRGRQEAGTEDVLRYKDYRYIKRVTPCLADFSKSHRTPSHTQCMQRRDRSKQYSKLAFVPGEWYLLHLDMAQPFIDDSAKQDDCTSSIRPLSASCARCDPKPTSFVTLLDRLA